jgi:hypothetical protein
MGRVIVILSQLLVPGWELVKKTTDEAKKFNALIIGPYGG